MPAQNHIHKYQRRKLIHVEVWACGFPDCTHYQPKYSESLVEGKKSICWQCGEEFILDSENMKEPQPRCNECRLGIGKSEDEIPMTDVMRDFIEGKIP